MKAFDLANFDDLYGSRRISNHLRKLEEEQAAWRKSITDPFSASDHARKIVESQSTASWAAERFQDALSTKEESARRMFASHADLHPELQLDRPFQHAFGGLSKQDAIAEQMALFNNPLAGIDLKLSGLPSYLEDAIGRATSLLSDSVVNAGLSHVSKREESVRRMLTPYADLHRDLHLDRGFQQALAGLSKQDAIAEQMAKFNNPMSGIDLNLSGIPSYLEDAIGRAKSLLSDSAVNAGLFHVNKQFDEANKHWAVPSALLDSLGPMKEWQDRIGKLSLPVMDWTSAATLASALGPGGIQAQLAALGINSDGSLDPAYFDTEEPGIGLSRKTLELLALLGFILAVLVPIYQEYSSAQSQAALEKKIEINTEMLKVQQKTIESLARLVEKALIKEAKLREQRFVVKERVATVFVKPDSGASEVGKLLPNEVVRPLAEEGKWVEIEYYHWLHQEYRTGWVLKKYFQRVARPTFRDEIDLGE